MEYTVLDKLVYKGSRLTVSIIWTHYSMVNTNWSIFRMIQQFFLVSEFLGLLQYYIYFEALSSFTIEPSHDKTNKMTCAPSEDSDQPGYPPSLISLCCPHEETLGP